MKKVYLLIILMCIGCRVFAQSTVAKVTKSITPINSSLPVVYQDNVKGGFHQVTDSNERNNFPGNLKETGMVVWQQDTHAAYQWDGSVWRQVQLIHNWEEGSAFYVGDLFLYNNMLVIAQASGTIAPSDNPLVDTGNWNSILSGSLTSANILVGNASGVATAVVVSGDATLDNAGALTIGSLAVEEGMLAADAVTTSKIKDVNVTEGKLADGAVTSVKIADATIVVGDLADAAVETAKIKDSNVTTAKIADQNVTATKLAGITTNGSSGQVLASNADGTLVWADGLTNTLASAKIFVGDGTNKAVAVALSGDATLDNAGALTIGSLAVEEGMLAADAVTTSKIKDVNVTEGKLADEAVTSAKIADATIVVGDLADAAVETAKIKDANVTTTKIADQNVTATKLAGITTNGSSGQVLASNADGTLVWADGLTNTLASAKIFVGDGTNKAVAVALSGDATLDNAGALTIGSLAVEEGMLAADAVTTAKIKDGTIVNADISATAAIAGSKISPVFTSDVSTTGDVTISGDDIIMGTNTAGYIMIADGTSFNPVAMSGDATIAGTGAVTVDKIKNIPLDFSTAPTNGQVLTYDQTNTKWIPGSVSTTDEKVKVGSSGTAQVLSTTDFDGSSDIIIKSGAVTSDKIADGTIVESDIGDGVITSIKIFNGTIAAADLSDMGASNGQILKYDGSVWTPAADGGITDGTATNNTLRWDGSAWTESTVLANDDTNISILNDLEVKGGDITTTATTFNLVNDVATTLNIGGASAATTIGAATGTTTIKNNLRVGDGTPATATSAEDVYIEGKLEVDNTVTIGTYTLPDTGGVTADQMLRAKGDGTVEWKQLATYTESFEVAATPATTYSLTKTALVADADYSCRVSLNGMELNGDQYNLTASQIEIVASLVLAQYDKITISYNYWK